jgi:hypothetical protein
MLAEKAIKKHSTIRQMLHSVEKQLPDGKMGDYLLLIRSLQVRIGDELTKMAKVGVEGRKVKWSEASASVETLLTHLAAISIAATKAMGSLIDDANAELEKE